MTQQFITASSRYVVKSGKNFLDYTGGQPHEVNIIDAKRYKTLSGAEGLALWWLELQARNSVPVTKVEIYQYTASVGKLEKVPPLTCTTCFGSNKVWDPTIKKYIQSSSPCSSCGI